MRTLAQKLRMSMFKAPQQFLRETVSLRGLAVVGAVVFYLGHPSHYASASNEGCPAGSQVVGAAPPKGSGIWCEKPLPDGRVVKTGPLRVWYGNGQLREERGFIDGVPDGKQTRWYQNGQLKDQRAYIEGTPDGTWTSYFNTGQIHEQMTYKGGSREGSATRYYKNGQLESRGIFKENLKEGVFERWYRNGQKREAGTFKEDVKEGAWNEWYEKNAQKKSQGNYLHGFKDGPWIDWQLNGQKRMEGTYLLGKRIGKWSYYAKDGKLRGQKVFALPADKSADQTKGGGSDGAPHGNEVSRKVGGWFDHFSGGERDSSSDAGEGNDESTEGGEGAGEEKDLHPDTTAEQLRESIQSIRDSRYKKSPAAEKPDSVRESATTGKHPPVKQKSKLPPAPVREEEESDE